MLRRLLLLTCLLSLSCKSPSPPKSPSPFPSPGTHPAIVEIVSHRTNGHTESVASGFVVSPDGLVVTALHEFDDSNGDATVTAAGRRYSVLGIVAWDDDRDLVVIKIKARDLPVLQLSTGIPPVHARLHGVAGDGELLAVRDGRLEASVPAEHGCSGSPLLDDDGRVVGVVTSYMSDGSMTFAAPAVAVEELLDHQEHLHNLDEPMVHDR